MDVIFHLEALKRFLTVKETAFVLNVSVDTIYKANPN